MKLLKKIFGKKPEPEWKQFEKLEKEGLVEKLPFESAMTVALAETRRDCDDDSAEIKYILPTAVFKGRAVVYHLKQPVNSLRAGEYAFILTKEAEKIAAG